MNYRLTAFADRKFNRMRARKIPGQVSILFALSTKKLISLVSRCRANWEVPWRQASG